MDFLILKVFEYFFVITVSVFFGLYLYRKIIQTSLATEIKIMQRHLYIERER